MKYLLIIILLVAPVNEINKIAKTNALKKQAKEAYEKGNFEEAIQTYHYLLDSIKVDEDGIRLNLANSYYQNLDTASAINFYNQLTASDKNDIASVAYQQLGVIKNKQKKQKEALADFKEALRKNPYNEEARYNYELLKKLLDEQKEEQQQNKDQQKQDKKEDQEQKQEQQKQNQQNQDQQDQEKKDQEQQQQDKEGKEGEEDQKDQQKQEQKPGEEEQKEEQKKNEGQPEEPSDDQQQKQDQMPISSEKLKEMNITEEKARMILEAMKNQEIQYLQQKTKKATQRQPSGKPDW